MTAESSTGGISTVTALAARRTEVDLRLPDELGDAAAGRPARVLQSTSVMTQSSSGLLFVVPLLVVLLVLGGLAVAVRALLANRRTRRELAAARGEWDRQ